MPFRTIPSCFLLTFSLLNSPRGFHYLLQNKHLLCLINVQWIHCCLNNDLRALLIHLLVVSSADFASSNNIFSCPPAFSNYTFSFSHLLTFHLFTLLFNASLIFIINSHHDQAIFIIVGESHNHIDKMLIHLKFSKHFKFDVYLAQVQCPQTVDQMPWVQTFLNICPIDSVFTIFIMTSP